MANPDQIIIASCLGRPMQLGMLYDSRSDSLVPGVTLWGRDILRQKKDVKKLSSSEISITAEDNFSAKAHLMDIEANLKMSFLCGMLKVEGAAKYLTNEKKSSKQARVTLRYSSKTFFENLSMDQLAIKNIEYLDVFDNDTATHVITAVEYGADAYLVFDRTESTSETAREIEGSLKATMNHLVKKISGKVKLDLSDSEKELTKYISCTFEGDVILENPPTTFEEGIEVYKTLPSLIKNSAQKDGIFGVPKKVYLYPLIKLDSKASKLVRAISANLVSEVENLLNHIQEINVRDNDLLSSKACQKFPCIQKQVIRFTSALSRFRSEFQECLSEKLMAIRGRGVEEAILLRKFALIKASPFDFEKLDAWINLKTREFRLLERYLETARPLFEKGICVEGFKPGDLDEVTQDSNKKYVICFSFGSINSGDNAFLDAAEKFSLTDEKPGNDVWELLDKMWFDDKKIVTNIREQMRLFSDFAMANEENRDLKCVVISGEKTEAPGTVILYVDGLEDDSWKLPSIPGVPVAMEIGETTVQIYWTAPDYGKEFISGYAVSYRKFEKEEDKIASEIGEDGKDDSSVNNKAGKETWTTLKTEKQDLTITNLLGDTEYFFKVAVISKPGAGKTSDEIKVKTNKPSHLLQTELMIPKCELIKKEEVNGRVVKIYQLPFRKVYYSDEIQWIDIGEPINISREKKDIYLGQPRAACERWCHTNFINQLANYIYGIDFPFQHYQYFELMTERIFENPNDVTVYFFHLRPGSRLPFDLSILSGNVNYALKNWPNDITTEVAQKLSPIFNWNKNDENSVYLEPPYMFRYGYNDEDKRDFKMHQELTHQ